MTLSPHSSYDSREFRVPAGTGVLRLMHASHTLQVRKERPPADDLHSRRVAQPVRGADGGAGFREPIPGHRGSAQPAHFRLLQPEGKSTDGRNDHAFLRPQTRGHQAADHRHPSRTHPRGDQFAERAVAEFLHHGGHPRARPGQAPAADREQASRREGHDRRPTQSHPHAPPADPDRA